MGEILAPIFFSFVLAWLLQASLNGILDLFYRIETKEYDYS
jgi:hypothetical protein